MDEPDERSSARLLFAPELAAGTVSEAELDRPEVRAAVRSRAIPSAPRRAAQRIAMKLGRRDYGRDCVEPLVAARRAVLGPAERGPRLLVRVDEFPHFDTVDEPASYGTAAYERFHSIMSSAGVPYLVAVVPRPAHAPLDPDAEGDRALDAGELEMLARLRADGVAFAAHGLDHRTRRRNARRRSELAGLPAAALEERLDTAFAELAAAGIAPRVFVPPFNRFDAAQYRALAERFDVVCGGDASVPLMGFHRTPLFRGGAVYMPGHAPLAERAGPVREAVERLADAGADVWVPVILHWGWEADDGWDELERLAEAMAPHAVDWEEFLNAVEASR